MSWSVNVIGKPQAVCEALARHGETLSGQSKVEYEEARPHLAGLLEQNFAGGPPYVEPVIHLEASGSGSVGAKGEQLQRSCQVSLKALWASLV